MLHNDFDTYISAIEFTRENENTVIDIETQFSNETFGHTIPFGGNCSYLFYFFLHFLLNAQKCSKA